MKNIFYRIATILMCCLCALPFFACNESEDDEAIGEAVVFGSEDALMSLSYKLYGKNAKQAAQEMIDQMRALNDAVSASYSESDIFKFNHMTEVDTPLEVSKFTFELVSISKEAVEDIYTKTGRRFFDPAVYPLIELWNLRAPYTNLHIAPEVLPDYGEVAAMLEYCKMELVEVYENDGKYFLEKKHPLVQIELGSVAKGYGADICRDICEEYGLYSGIINLSGNNYLYKGKGKADDQTDFIVTIEDPRGGGIFCAIMERDTSLVASGDYNNYYEKTQGDQQSTVRFPHIIDPESGLPLNVEYDELANCYTQKTDGLFATTIVGRSSAYSDIYSTATILMQMDEAIEFLTDTEYKGIFIAQSSYAMVGEFDLYDHPQAEHYKNYTRYEYSK